MKKINDLRSIEAGYGSSSFFSSIIAELKKAYGDSTYGATGTIFCKPVTGPALDLTVALSDTDYVVPIKGSLGSLSFDLTGLLTAESLTSSKGLSVLFGYLFKKI